ncbi:uncharacterized protein BJ171DRAFT_301251 [Polychytrium aggregatum]|uniref:uncharacterized protein n=1 Tax=Polychytrium aggregatum TaxID=110093 RepID=UPI0022FE8A62|nr:uncharacterized protein BJ171DRAFT_301251 [Polychytrium aggregatum]KAI9193203.1 hypothetical protein BJ171DRAFT_301251 [Polychytrium aggregatum]
MATTKTGLINRLAAQFAVSRYPRDSPPIVVHSFQPDPTLSRAAALPPYLQRSQDEYERIRYALTFKGTEFYECHHTLKNNRLEGLPDPLVDVTGGYLLLKPHEPLLQNGSDFIVGFSAILRFLEIKFPEPSYFYDPSGDALMETHPPDEFIHWADNVFYPATSPLLELPKHSSAASQLSSSTSKVPPDSYPLYSVLSWVESCFKTSRNPWFVKDTVAPTLADIVLYGPIHRSKRLFPRWFQTASSTQGSRLFLDASDRQENEAPFKITEQWFDQMNGFCGDQSRSAFVLPPEMCLSLSRRHPILSGFSDMNHRNLGAAFTEYSARVPAARVPKDGADWAIVRSRPGDDGWSNCGRALAARLLLDLPAANLPPSLSLQIVGRLKHWSDRHITLERYVRLNAREPPTAVSLTLDSEHLDVQICSEDEAKSVTETQIQFRRDYSSLLKDVVPARPPPRKFVYVD